jgi:hypothetical protein
MSCNYTFFNSQFTFISQLPLAIEPISYVWKMLTGKLLVNSKCKMVNIPEGIAHANL